VLLAVAANMGRKKVAKNRHLGTIAQLCQAISSQLRHISTIRKNLLSSSNSSTCPHNMVNFGPLAAEILLLVWGTPANFNGFRVLASLLQRRRSTELRKSTKLCTMFGRLLPWYAIYTLSGLLPPNGILSRAKFTLCPSMHHRTSFSGYIFATKASIDNRKKLTKQQYVLQMSPQYGNFGPLAAEIGPVFWGTPANLNCYRVLAALLHAM